MWVKKNDSELEEEELVFNKKAKKKRWRAAGVMFIILVPACFLMMLFCEYLITVHEWHSWRNSLTFDDIISNWPYTIIVISILIAPFCIFNAIFWYKSEHPKYNCTTEKCDKCFLVRSINPKLPSTCQCGGHYYPIYVYKWVDPKKHPIVSSTD